MKISERSLLALFAIFFLSLGASAQVWVPMQTTGSISARSNASAVFVPQRNEMVVFGGTDSNGRTNDVWALNVSTGAWRQIVSNSSSVPAPRHTQNAVYDSANDRMLIFSGQGGGLFNDVWAFTFADSSWTELSANGNTTGVPLVRYGGVTEYDSLNSHFVTFAGFTSSGRFDDTWTFAPGTMTWNDVSQGVFPTKRCLFNSTQAHDRREMLIYGGQGTGNFDDIWSCDLDTYTWTNLTPAVKPQGRHFASLIYRGNGEVVLFGGNRFNQNNFNGGLNDVWSFHLDSLAWTMMGPGGTPPDARTGHVAVYVPAEDKMVIFGGNRTNGNFTDDVWELLFDTATDVEDPRPAKNIALYPNPADASLTIDFSLDVPADVELRIYDQQGRVVQRLREPAMPAGQAMRRIDISALGSGIYFYDWQGTGLRGKFVKL